MNRCPPRLPSASRVVVANVAECRPSLSSLAWCLAASARAATVRGLPGSNWSKSARGRKCRFVPSKRIHKGVTTGVIISHRLGRAPGAADADGVLGEFDHLLSLSRQFAAAPAAPMAKSISCRRYASISKLHMLSSAIAAIASFTFAIDFSAIALLKLATRASQSKPKPRPLKTASPRAKSEVASIPRGPGLLHKAPQAVAARESQTTTPKQRADRRYRDHRRHDTSIVIRGKRRVADPTATLGAGAGSYAPDAMAISAQARRDNPRA